MTGSTKHFLLLVLPMVLLGCKHETADFDTDTELFERARSNEASVWYKLNDTLLPRSSNSGHSEALLRTRFNATAASALDSLGRVFADTTFRNGSLIVKELWPDANGIGTYAVMLKRPSDPSADDNGWVWGYIRSSGEVRQSAIDQGAVCRGCHAQTGSVDGTLMNAYFP
jgi:hypothetical protein